MNLNRIDRIVGLLAAIAGIVVLGAMACDDVSGTAQEKAVFDNLLQNPGFENGCSNTTDVVWYNPF